MIIKSRKILSGMVKLFTEYCYYNQLQFNSPKEFNKKKKTPAAL